MDTDRHEFTPAYDFSGPNESTVLATGPVDARFHGRCVGGVGSVELVLTPKAEVRIVGSFKGLSLPEYLNLEKVTAFTFEGHKIEGWAARVDGGTAEGSISVTWAAKSEPIQVHGNDNTEIDSVVFHLFNFVPFIGAEREMQKRDGGVTAIEVIRLEGAELAFELKSLLSTRDTLKQLQAEGGYGLTHVGRFRRRDGRSFSGEEALEHLRLLRLFLSFVRGTWCYPVCSVGSDSSGDRVWEAWISPRGAWRRPFGWFDPHHPEQMVEFFRRFSDKWADEGWAKVLNAAVYWYILANENGRGPDAGIILSQAALELLSYQYCVVEKRLLEKDGFKKLRASDKLRLLFSSLGIPLDVPQETPKLRVAVDDSKNAWIDAPHALTEIRNALVHPNLRQGHGKLYFDAWNLSLWYLEMSILAICGYSGTYGNRLNRNAMRVVEPVPWQR